MHKVIFGTYLALILVLFPATTEAGPILRSGDNISIDSAQMLTEDFYGLSPQITISGTAEHDVYVGGNSITINAPVKGDLTVIGGMVQIHGDIGDDVRIVAGGVTIGKEVKGDVVVLGGTLTVLSTAKIEGDIFFMGGELILEGEVVGSIHGNSKDIRINAPVQGSVSYVASESFALGNKARITGDISYRSYGDIVRAQDAVVEGEIQKMTMRTEVERSIIKMYLIQTLVLLFAALSLSLLFRKHIEYILTKENNSFGMTGLVGLLVLIAVPFIATLFMISVLGAMLGLILLLAYILLLVLTVVLAGIMLGYHVQVILTKQKSLTLKTVVGGVLLLSCFALVPYLGGFILFALIVIALGTISTTLYSHFRT